MGLFGNLVSLMVLALVCLISYLVVNKEAIVLVAVRGGRNITNLCLWDILARIGLADLRLKE